MGQYGNHADESAEERLRWQEEIDRRNGTNRCPGNSQIDR